jgi:hypothetical protein
MAYSFSVITGLMQMISLLLVDVEMGKKLDKVIELLGKDRS